MAVQLLLIFFFLFLRSDLLIKAQKQTINIAVNFDEDGP